MGKSSDILRIIYRNSIGIFRIFIGYRQTINLEYAEINHKNLFRFYLGYSLNILKISKMLQEMIF